MSHSRGWRWSALGVIVLGVPGAACGGRAMLGSSRDGGASSSSTTTPSGTETGTSTGTATTPTGSGSATGTTTSTSTPTGTATGTATGSGSSTSTGACTSPSAFGPFPCTAYTAWYYSCPPIAGTGGCKYAVPIVSGDPTQGWTDSTSESQPPGAQLQIVAPTDTGGSTCEVLTNCTCNASSTWVGKGYCPNN